MFSFLERLELREEKVQQMFHRQRLDINNHHRRTRVTLCRWQGILIQLIFKHVGPLSRSVVE